MRSAGRPILSRDALIWPAVTLGDAVMLLNFTAAAFLATWQLEARPEHLAFVGGAYWIIYTPMALVWARVGGRLGMRRTAIGGAALLLLASLLMTRAGELWHLMAAAGTLGLGASALWPNVEGALSEGRQGTPLRRRLAVFNVSWCLGLAVGPALGVLVYPDKVTAMGPEGREAVNAAFYATAAMAAGVLALLALWRPAIPPATGAEASAPPSTTDRDDPPHDPVRLRAFQLMALSGNFACYIVLGVLRHLYEKLADVLWHDQASQRHHWLLAALAASSVVTFAVLFFAHRWHYRLKRHLAWQMLLAGSLLVVALAGNFPWALAGFVGVGAATAFVYSGSLFYSIEGRASEHHEAGWHEAFIGGGNVAGLLLTGYMPAALGAVGVASEYWLLRSPYLLASGLCAVGVVVQLAIYLTHARRFART